MKKESLYNEINDNSSSKEEKPHLSMHTNEMKALGNEFVECEEMQYIEDPIENVFGTYNGWINWREKEMAVYYAASCMNILEQGVEQILNSVEKIK